MAQVMTAEEFARESGADLAALKASIEEARNDTITKETMNRASLTSRNITADTERYMRNYLENANT